jgi:hypothetical protein
MSKKKHDGPNFVMVTETVLDSPAWRAMSHGARSLYIALRRRYWPNRKNNGHICLPQRKAAKELGSGRTEIGRWFRELQYYGFIVMTTPGYLGVEGKGRAPRWRLTEVAYMRGTSSKGMEDMPTTDFLKWNGVRLSKHQEGGDRLRAESRSRKRGHTGPENGATHGPENGATRHNYRSRKRGQGNGPSGPENGDNSINHVGGWVGSVKEESSEDAKAAQRQRQRAEQEAEITAVNDAYMAGEITQEEYDGYYRSPAGSAPQPWLIKLRGCVRGAPQSCQRASNSRQQQRARAARTLVLKP